RQGELAAGKELCFLAGHGCQGRLGKRAHGTTALKRPQGGGKGEVAERTASRARTGRQDTGRATQTGFADKAGGQPAKGGTAGKVDAKLLDGFARYFGHGDLERDLLCPLDRDD